MNEFVILALALLVAGLLPLIAYGVYRWRKSRKPFREASKKRRASTSVTLVKDESVEKPE